MHIIYIKKYIYIYSSKRKDETTVTSDGGPYDVGNPGQTKLIAELDPNTPPPAKMWRKRLE